MPTTEFLPFATDPAANLDTQSNYAGSSYRPAGFTTGRARSAQANKVWRQSSIMAAAWANVVMTTLAQSVPDDGNLTNLIAQLNSMLSTVAANAGKPHVVVVGYSSSPAFDCSAGNAAHPVFQITLTGPVVSSSIVNRLPGQLITIHVIQDATGGRSFVAPAVVPMAAIDTTPNQVNTQTFAVLNDSSLVAASGMLLRL
jgi:hypothetical protein